MLVATALPRVFTFTNDGQPITLPDPGSSLSAESVLNFYSATYPLLTTAKIDGPHISNDKVEYKFVSVLGTKG